MADAEVGRGDGRQSGEQLLGRISSTSSSTRGARYGTWAGFCFVVGLLVLALSPGLLVETGVFVVGLFVTLLSIGLVLLNAAVRASR